MLDGTAPVIPAWTRATAWWSGWLLVRVVVRVVARVVARLHFVWGSGFQCCWPCRTPDCVLGYLWTDYGLWIGLISPLQGQLVPF